MNKCVEDTTTDTSKSSDESNDEWFIIYHVEFKHDEVWNICDCVIQNLLY